MAYKLSSQRIRSREGDTRMKKPSITFYCEKKPEHYVGSDINITLKCNASLTDGDIENVLICLQTGLFACDYPFTDDESTKRL